MATMLNPNAIPDGSITQEKIDASVLEAKQDVIDDLETIRSNANKGSTALQSYTESDPVYIADKPKIALKSEIPDISGLATKEEVAAKQDTIPDLISIRDGASKGATALQSESDPVYLADKPKLALKTEIPDVSGKVDKETGKGLSSNDYTNAEKAKLAGLENYDDTQIKTLITGKQNVIDDLATIRSGASKGSTALQSYTETDPIYTADKPSIALKSEIPDVSGKADKTLIVTETEGSASYTIVPNKLTKLGTLASSVTFSLNSASEEAGVANIYDFIFTTPTNAPSII